MDWVERFCERRPRTAWLAAVVITGICSLIALSAIGVILLIWFQGLTP